MEDLNEWVEKLKESKKIVIVEGKKDKKALEDLGVESVFALDKSPLYKVIEHIADHHKDCVLLVDLDKEGKKLFAKLNSGLSERGVRVDKRFREFLFNETKLRQIEGIRRYFERNIC